MNIRIYQVDAFTDRLFSGNSAAVCPLETWLSDDLLQKIAMENNLSETAFYVKSGDRYEIRWFTPLVEVDLCGHATLAAAFILFGPENHRGECIEFFSGRSGLLTVKKREELLVLDFPSDQLQQVRLVNDLHDCFDIEPLKVLKGNWDYIFIYRDENEIRSISPNLRAISRVEARGVIITAPGTTEDFVSRFFAPQCGIDEDPVTGSAHTSLTPYWAAELKKNQLSARQLSARTGYLWCRLLGDRVEIAGYARLYLQGEIYLD